MKMGSPLVSLAYRSNFLPPLDVLPFTNENFFKLPVKGHQSMSMCQGENPALSCIPSIGSDQSVNRIFFEVQRVYFCAQETTEVPAV